MQHGKLKLCYPPIILIIINTLLFIICLINPSFERHGAINIITFFQLHEYWRLLTYMFIHGGIFHLIFNMISLYYLSTINLKAQSITKYLITYFSAGIIGGFLSICFKNFIEDSAFSVGASGAVMGLIGSCIVLLLQSQYKTISKQILVRNLIFMSIINLIPTTKGIDYSTHFFGFVIGIFITVLLNKTQERRSSYDI